ncbi:hypothetical protein [Salinibacter sp. 10B]|uniref:hypothetical protein n=1 Tax=Salinibacter sp. 10B TaxID=1923971 RepID=UPI001C611A75|nr:hypothetical protein [Salinibacter sp. 10B]
MPSIFVVLTVLVFMGSPWQGEHDASQMSSAAASFSQQLPVQDVGGSNASTVPVFAVEKGETQSDEDTPTALSAELNEPAPSSAVSISRENASAPFGVGERSIESPVPYRSALPVVHLPDHRVDALLALSSRTLATGWGRTSGLLLVPADSLRDRLRIALPTGQLLPVDVTRGQPSSTINTPTGYGPRWGQVFAGVGYQERIRYDDWTDGVASAGFGLGNPTRYVGLDVTVNILDTYTEFAEDRSLSLKLHRRLPFHSAIAVGHENIWHTDGTDGGSSRYVVVSKVVLLRDRPASALGSMVFNVGLGTDRFLREADFARGADGMNPFGSVAVRVLPPVNAIANWTGQDLALGLSIAPVPKWPIVITPAMMDVTGAAGDGARFSMSAGISYDFRR